MPPSNICWGLEIGSAAIKALKLELDGDQLAVRDFAVLNHPKVLSTPDLDQDDALRLALGTLTSQLDFSDAQVAISLPGQQSFARFAKLPPVEPKQVPNVVRFEAGQQIPFPLEEVEWDYQTFASPDSPEVEVGIFAVTRQRIMERLNLLSDYGITPDFATLSPISVYNALAYDLSFVESTPGTIVLDIGTLATDMIVAHQGRVWVRTFPIGGHHFTEALVDQFKISYAKAEKLKRESEQSKHARHVFSAMRPVFTDLVQEVQRSIGYYQSLHPGAELERLVGTGSTFKLPGLRKYIKQQLSMDVYRIEQFKRLSVEGPRAGEFQAASLNLTAAYGLALQGLGNATLRANLMPSPVVREAMWKQKTPWFVAAAAVAAVASGTMFLTPLLDSSAVVANPVPASVTQAVSAARSLKNQADELSLGEQQEADFTASKLGGLTLGRELFGYIANDVSEMVAYANQAGAGRVPPGEPVLTLERMSTAFVPGAPRPQSGAAAAEGDGADGMGSGGGTDNSGGFTPGGFNAGGVPQAGEERTGGIDTSGGGAAASIGGPMRPLGGDGAPLTGGGTPRDGGREGRRGGGPSVIGTDPEGNAPRTVNEVRGSELDVVYNDRVEVTVTLETTAEDVNTLMIDTVESWVRENLDRQGVPYRLVPGEPLATFESVSQVASSQGARSGRGGFGGASRRGGLGTGRDIGGGEGGETTSSAAAGDGGQSAGISGPMSPAGNDRNRSRRGGGSRGGGSATSGEQALELSSVKPPATQPPVRGRITVKYFVVLEQPTAAAPVADDADTGEEAAQ